MMFHFSGEILGLACSYLGSLSQKSHPGCNTWTTRKHSSIFWISGFPRCSHAVVCGVSSVLWEHVPIFLAVNPRCSTWAVSCWQQEGRCGLKAALPSHSRAKLSQLPAALFPRHSSDLSRGWDAPGMNCLCGTNSPFPATIFPRESVPEAAWKGRREVGWGQLALGGTAWGKQDNVGVHFLLQKMSRLIMCSSKIYGILGCTGFFLGFEKKDQLAELLDVDARCIWMWFALFLNNRQF